MERIFPTSTTLLHQKVQNTRLSSIESQPEKVVVLVAVVVVVVVFLVVFVGGGVVVVIIVGHRNFTLKLGPNRVNNKWYIVDVVDPEI